MERIIQKYKTFLLLGLIIVLISFGVGLYRTSNQVTLSQLEFDGDTSSSDFRAALTTEAVLMRYSEIVPLLGLGFLKLGIGFAIATIVTNIRATGKNARESLKKANLNIEELSQPFFSRYFPRFLLLGIIIELVAVVVMSGWIFTGLSLIDLQFSGLTDSLSFHNMTILDTIFGVLAEPLEGLGVTFLIGGIAFGLVTIVANLGMQVTSIPKNLIALATGKKVSSESGVMSVIPKKLVRVTILGMIITASGLLLAIIRVFNVTSLENMIFSGDTASLAYQNALVTERMIGFSWETWMFVGISIMLFAIGYLLLRIISLLSAQRINLSKAVSDITGQKVPSLDKPLWTTRYAPLFLIAGLVWMIVFFGVFNIMRDLAGLAVLGEQFAGNVGSDIFKQNTISQSTLGILVRPGKAISMALLFSGIGLSLVTIVINLRLTALVLPGSFAKISNAIKGESVASKDSEAESIISPMSFAPKKLFYGIVVGAVIIVLGTFPLALLRIFNTEIFLTELLAGQTSSAAFETAKQTQLMLEHFIGPWVTVGVGLIFFSIGKFFSTIVIFVKARRIMMSEGIESAVYHALNKKS